jgi:hypothetical protein
LFNNSVVDLSGMTHPGGEAIWRAVQGREISRFIYGAYAIESTPMKPYKHSEYAMRMIEAHTIGHLKPIPFFIS